MSFKCIKTCFICNKEPARGLTRTIRVFPCGHFACSTCLHPEPATTTLFCSTCGSCVRRAIEGMDATECSHQVPSWTLAVETLDDDWEKRLSPQLSGFFFPDQQCMFSMCGQCRAERYLSTVTTALRTTARPQGKLAFACLGEGLDALTGHDVQYLALSPEDKRVESLDDFGLEWGNGRKLLTLFPSEQAWKKSMSKNQVIFRVCCIDQMMAETFDGESP